VQSLRRNSIASAAGSGFRLAVVVLAQPLLIATLGMARYGQWAVLMALVALSAIADLGVANAVTVTLPQAQADPDRERALLSGSLAMILVLGCAVAAVCLLAAPLLYDVLFSTGEYAGEMVPALRLVGLAALGRLVTLWLQGWAAGLRRYDIPAKADSVMVIVQNAGLIGLSAAGQSLVILSAWLVLSTWGGALLHVVLLRRAGQRLMMPRWHAAESREVAGVGILYWGANVSSLVFMNGDRLLVNRIMGAEAVALYALGVSIVGKINEVSALPIRPIVPEIAHRLRTGEEHGNRDVFFRAIEVNSALTLVLAAAVMWAAGPVSVLLIHEKGALLAPLLRALALVYACYSTVAPPYYLLIAYRNLWPVFIWSWLGTIATLALIPVLAPFGIVTVAWANLAYSLVLVTNFRAARLLGLPPGVAWMKLVRPMVSFAAVFTAASLLAPRGIAASAAGFAASLLLAVWIDPRDAAEVLRTIMRRPAPPAAGGDPP